jgi:hypothetical protein
MPIANRPLFSSCRGDLHVCEGVDPAVVDLANQIAAAKSGLRRTLVERGRQRRG